MVNYLCEMFNVSHTGYYRHLATEGQRQEREANDQWARGMIKKAYAAHGYVKCSRGIKMTLPINMTSISIARGSSASCENIRSFAPYRKQIHTRG